MATDLASRIQEDHLTCHICFQPFTKPKALPCLHTFCEECLRDFITSRGFDSQGHFQCPICRKEIEIPATGVSGFQDNHLVQSLSHTVTGPEPPATRTGPEMSQPDPNFRPTPAPRKSKIKLQPESETEGSSVDGTPQVSNPEQTQEGNPAPVQAPYRPTDPVATQVPYSTPSAPYPHIPDPTQAPVIPPPIPQPPPWLPNPLPTTGIYPDLPPPYSPPPYPETQGRPRATSTGAIACSNGLVQQIGQYGNTVRDFQRPKGLAVGLNNEIIVSDLGGNRILVFDQQGQLQGCFKCDCIVHDLTVTPKGTILVAVNQSKSAIMREYTMSGRFVANHGNYYKFENPSGIALNSDGFSIVTCLDSCVMYIFTDQKKMSQKIGSKGSGIEHFLSPYHVAVNNKDQIFVSDCGNNCIKVFSKAGKFKMNIGREGSGPGELRAPLGVCTNVDGYIIVADSGNFRVQVFNQRGQYHCIPLENTHKIGVDVKPTNVAVTDHNNLVVLLSGAGFAEVRVYSFKSENGIYCSTCYTQ